MDQTHMLLNYTQRILSKLKSYYYLKLKNHSNFLFFTLIKRLMT